MADSDDSLTPEQRLLRLIEESGGNEEAPSAPSASDDGGGGDEAAPAAAKPQRPKISIDWKAMLSPSAIRAKIEHLRENVVDLFQNKKHDINLKDVNKLLVIVVMVLVMGVLVNGAYEMNIASKDFLERFDLSQKKMADLLLPEGHTLSDAFLDGSGQRNIFVPYVPEEVTTVVQESNDALRLVELTRTLKLTGISFSEEATRNFCMIEDLEKSITTFLRVGESISGMVVDEIKADSVVLKLGDETLEIR